MIIVITTMNSNSITLTSVIIKRNNYNNKYSLSIATVLELIAINLIVFFTMGYIEGPYNHSVVMPKYSS